MKYRLTAFFAGLALVISFLSGFLGGVNLGLIVLRGLLGAVAFGLLGLVVEVVSRRYLPEAGVEERREPSEGAVPDQADSPIGGAVDIVLPEELPGDDIMADDDIDLPPQDVAELEEVGAADPFTEGSAPAERPPEESAEETVAELEDVDALPSMDAFDGSSTTTDFGLGEEPELEHAGGDVSIMGHGTDPGEAAKAVRTWLKRDKEG